VRRLGIRARITAAVAVATTALLLAVGGFVYQRTGADLLESVDAGLRSRADVIVTQVRSGAAIAVPQPELIESDEAFVQVLDRGGAVLRSSRIVAGAPLLDASTVAGVRRPELFDRHVAGIDDVTRVLAVGVPGGRVVLVGSSLQDRRDQLLQLGWTLAAGGAVALALICLGGWFVVGAALRPVERMRREASAISAPDDARRLAPPAADDELRALGVTLNEMLDRLSASFERERRFVEDASHELRTPIAVLRARLELAGTGARPRADLESAISRSRADAEHLSRLAEDLLVLQRMRGGDLAIGREATDVAALVGSVADGHAARAAARGVAIERETAPGTMPVDPLRLRQAVDNLLDNALRHADSRVRVETALDGAVLVLRVEDDGPGFAPAFLGRAFEPFARDGGGDPAGSGLGLAIVRAIAVAHGGSVVAENVAGSGARVTARFGIG
jgi:signal transduction histidine kinase